MKKQNNINFNLDDNLPENNSLIKEEINHEDQNNVNLTNEVNNETLNLDNSITSETETSDSKEKNIKEELESISFDENNDSSSEINISNEILDPKYLDKWGKPLSEKKIRQIKIVKKKHLKRKSKVILKKR